MSNLNKDSHEVVKPVDGQAIPYVKPAVEAMPIEQVVAAGGSGLNDFGAFKQP